MTGLEIIVTVVVVAVIFAVKVELLLALVMFTFVELERMPTLWETTNVKVTVGLA